MSHYVFYWQAGVSTVPAIFLVDLNTLRYALAALHYNENANRRQAVNVRGNAQFALRYPKYKQGGHTIKQIKTRTTHSMYFLFSFLLLTI